MLLGVQTVYAIDARRIEGTREEKLEQLDEAIQEVLDIKVLECAADQRSPHGPGLRRCRDSVLCHCGRVRRRLRSARRESLMTLDYIVGLIVTLGLLVYLTYAFLKPEKF